MELRLKTDANISTTGPINCKELNLAADCIALKHNITTDNDFIVYYNKKLENETTINVGTDIIFKGSVKSSFLNKGSFYVNRSASYGGLAKELINYGEFYARTNSFNIKNLYNYGLISSSREIFCCGGEKLVNAGTIYGRRNAYLGCNSNIINESTGIIKSDFKVTLFRIDLHNSVDIDELPITCNLINRGVVEAGKFLCLQEDKGIVSNEFNASLKADDVKILTCKLVNNGEIVTAKRINFDCTKLINEGVIHSKGELNFWLSYFINTVSGKVTSNADIRFNKIKHLINEGFIQAEEKLNINFESMIINHEKGKIISKNFLAIVNILMNEGEINIEQNSKIIGLIIENLKSGTIKSEEKLEAFISQHIHNRGKIQSGAIYLNSKKYANDHQIGLISMYQDPYKTDQNPDANTIDTNQTQISAETNLEGTNDNLETQTIATNQNLDIAVGDTNQIQESSDETTIEDANINLENQNTEINQNSDIEPNDINQIQTSIFISYNNIGAGDINSTVETQNFSSSNYNSINRPIL